MGVESLSMLINVFIWNPPAFTSPKNTPRHPPSKPQAQAQAPRPPKPPHIQKVSGSIPAGSSSVLLLLLAVGCWLRTVGCWLPGVAVVAVVALVAVVVAVVAAVAFGGASRHAAGEGVSSSGAGAIELWCCCCSRCCCCCCCCCCCRCCCCCCCFWWWFSPCCWQWSFCLWR